MTAGRPAFHPDPAVTLLGGIGASSAYCPECDWTRTATGRSAWLALRAAGRRHVTGTGHPLLVKVEHTYTYALVGPRRPQGAHL